MDVNQNNIYKCVCACTGVLLSSLFIISNKATIIATELIDQLIYIKKFVRHVTFLVVAHAVSYIYIYIYLYITYIHNIKLIINDAISIDTLLINMAFALC